MTSLKAKTTKGLFWSFLDSFGVYLIKFCFSIVIARTLSPGDYGVMGMIIIFISLGQLLSEGGFAMALVQKKEAAAADYSTVFWFNIITGVIIYAILFFSAGAIADFFRTPQLTGVTRVAALVIVINALVTVQSVQLSRRMEFKKQAAINLVSSLLS
ncbi:lipopolysaccharide biosynthesis protein, partial [bacterium]|nr:lipopolysaccharide biosynthesis protein [bacterium]